MLPSRCVLIACKFCGERGLLSQGRCGRHLPAVMKRAAAGLLALHSWSVYFPALPSQCACSRRAEVWCGEVRCPLKSIYFPRQPCCALPLIPQSPSANPAAPCSAAGGHGQGRHPAPRRPARALGPQALRAHPRGRLPGQVPRGLLAPDGHHRLMGRGEARGLKGPKSWLCGPDGVVRPAAADGCGGGHAWRGGV